MASVFDVAQYILQKQGRITAMTLQKLVYYSQAWSLVWDEEPLFEEKIEAWSNGPVVRKLFNSHRGCFLVSKIPKGDPSKLTTTQKETIDAVLDFYGHRTAQWLCDLTHMEDPWRQAREGVPEGRQCDNEITHSMMHEYYASIPEGT